MERENAVRRTGGDQHLAQDIAQKVFADLARQGRRLPPDTLMGGWLHRHTCFVASTVMRTESRRTTRERQAAAMNPTLETPESQPAEAAPAAAPESPVVSPGQIGAATSPADTLQLTLVAADSGKPLPNVEIDYQAYGEGGHVQKTLFTTRAGISALPRPPKGTMWFRLTTRTEGFADTRLSWLPSQGDVIPKAYTLRVIRAARISGRVVDAAGTPVAGAKIGIGYQDDPLLDARPESHLFGWIGTTTDVDGSWSVHRIAPLMIRRLHAAASHPEHTRSETLEVAKQRDAEKQLRDGTHLFRLGAPATVHGVVVDPSGNPVGNAKVLIGWLDEVSSREGRTETDGTFSIRGCKPGKTYLTAEADGFAPTTEHIEVMMDTPPVRLTLEAGRTLVLRVINLTNQPVAGASVFLRRENEPSVSDSGSPAPVQASLPQSKTDANGQLIWSNAPNREKLMVDVSRRGYMRQDFVPVRPDGAEQVIRLGPALTIAGTVRDAGTGALIPNFRIVLGWPDADRPRWSSLSRHWLTFRDGTFRHTLEELIISGTKDPRYVVKVEATGYASAVSRVIRPDEGEVRLDVSLQRRDEQAFTVYDPDGPWTANEVRGGRHLVQVRVQSFTPERRAVSEAMGNAWIDLPPVPSGTPIDLGEIVLQRP